MKNKKSDQTMILKGDIGFLLLLTFLNVLNMVDRQLLASLSNYIIPDLKLSNTEYGLLTGLGFLFFYSIAGLFMGMLADTVNRTRLITFGLALWSGFTALSGAARSFIGLAIPRVFIGIGESIITPSAISLLADRFPSASLGFATGFYYLGVPIGAGISLLIAGYLAPIVGWRNCFYLLGSLGIFLSLIMWFFKETPRRYSRPTAENEASGRAANISHVARLALETIPKSPALMMTIAGAMAMSVFFGTIIFEQLWLVQERGFERSEIARLAGWLALTGGILGNLFGGIGSDIFVRKIQLARPLFLFWILLVLAPIAIIYRIVPEDSVWIKIGLFFGMFQVGAFYGPIFSTVQELVPAQIRSTSIALLLLMMNLVGTGIGVTVSGIVLDILIERGIDQPYTITLLALTIIGLFSIPCFLFAGLRFERDKKRVIPATPSLPYT